MEVLIIELKKHMECWDFNMNQLNLKYLINYFI